MVPIKPLLLSCVISLVFALGAGAQTGDEKLLERVKSQYPRALEALEGVYAHARGSGTSKVTIPLKPSGERVISAVFSFALDGESQRFVKRFTVTSPERTESRDEVDCINPDYSFSLSREDFDKPYLLNAYEAGRSETVSRSIGALGREFLFAPFMVEDISILSLLGSSGFRVKGAKEIPDNERRLIEIEIEATEANSRPSAASLVVSPDNGWALERSVYFFHPAKKRPFHCTIEYTNSGEGVRYPRRVLILEPSGIRREIEFSDVSFGSSAKGQFLLSAFGLPELSRRTGGDLPRSHTAELFVGLATLSLLVALALRYLVARAQSSKASV